MNHTHKALFKFQSASTAEKVLTNKALRVSRFKQLNDPFELFAISLRDRELRERHRGWVNALDEKYGMISFSHEYNNPVMWSHYSDEHKGVCIQFSVDHETIFSIKYVEERLFFGLSAENFLDHIKKENSLELLLTKYNHWKYEKEARIISKISECENIGEYFFEKFDTKLKPTKLFLGPRYKSGSNPGLRKAVVDLGLNGDLELPRSRRR